ncbi:hypothetical protein BTJ68_00202 [Hortaea werneckii EXF-2000]|uniref:Azaphilone pigments biosynthesis cluster protein L N-terminal domain-containing protein n=1 Tax=Hortaea werneckii EXF-2000 TaxID=1157616 RepID=A0A1Z5TVF3_HORWE|nr:hypothetical protein BTJ68_00202 [Hortaea werneckii EXF-2000]
MDPLSITASCIAILEASTATGKALNKLIALRKAPEDLQQLFNEREASRALLVVVRSTLLKIQGTAVYRDNREALEQLLTRFRNEIGSLDALLEYQLTQPEANSNGLAEVRKLQWMKAGPKIRDIKQRIRDARSGLKSAFDALNLQQSVDAYQTALQIQTVVFQNQEDSQYRQATLLEEFTTQRTESRRANERLQHSIADVSATGREQARIDTKRHEELLLLLRDLQLRQPSWSARIHAYDAAPLRDPMGNQAINGPITDAIAPSTVRITATMATNRCPPICKCCCHVRTSFATPRYLQRFLGQLMLDYTSLLQPKACNYPPCKKRPGKSQFTYVFPTWFASRSLIVNGTSGGLTGIGASWTLRIPFILPNSDLLWRYIEDDDLSSLRHRISRYIPNLNVVDEDGYSPMLLLVANFASVNSTDTAGWTPLHWAAYRDDIISSKLLLEWRANVDAVDKMGSTPLIIACRFGSRECVQLLIEKGADVRTIDANGQTVLFRLSNDCASFVGDFIRSGVHLEQRNVEGVTTLVDSITGEESSAVTAALCAMGADIDCRDESGQNAIGIAIFNNNAGGLETLVQHLQQRSEVTMAYGSEDIMQASSSKAGKKALHGVSKGEASQSMPLSRPSSPRHWAPDKYGCNALHDAALYGGTQVLKILAGADLRGLDPLEQDKRGNTPDDCFYQYRDINCDTVRAPLEEEEAAWRTLMNSARRQNGLLIDCEDDESLNYSYDPNRNDKYQVVHWNADDWGTSSDESGDESQDEDIFQDAVQEL